MKIYLDYIFVINFLFDFILLTATAELLKRNIKLKKIIFGSIFGGFTSFILLLNISSLLFFIIKMFLGIVLVIITFNYKDFKYTMNNFFYLMINSVLLGGGLYLFNISIDKTNQGLSFFSGNKAVNLLILLVISILLLYLYSKSYNKYKREITKYYKVDIYLNNKIYNCNGYLDTGNKLEEPYTKQPVILVSNKKIQFKNPVFVPYHSLNSSGLIKCIKVEKIYIHKVGFKSNVFIGQADKFLMEGIDLILNERILD